MFFSAKSENDVIGFIFGVLASILEEVVGTPELNLLTTINFKLENFDSNQS